MLKPIFHSTLLIFFLNVALASNFTGTYFDRSFPLPEGSKPSLITIEHKNDGPVVGELFLGEYYYLLTGRVADSGELHGHIQESKSGFEAPVSLSLNENNSILTFEFTDLDRRFAMQLLSSDYKDENWLDAETAWRASYKEDFLGNANSNEDSTHFSLSREQVESEY